MRQKFTLPEWMPSDRDYLPGRETRHCLRCNKPFRVHLSSKVRYCQSECWYASMRESAKALYVKRTCEYCGAEFSVKPSLLRKRSNTGAFCSRPCYFAAKKGRILRPFEVRWADMVNLDGPLVRPPLAQCWMWTGYIKSNGYGTIGLGTNEQGKIHAHQASWVIHFGPIPDGMQVCHHCDNRACVNPHHLFVDTAQGNLDDMRQKGRKKTILQPSDIPTIRERSANGERYDSIAPDYGVGPQAIYDVIRRKTWGHID